jgi:hypothetical protein
MVAEEVFVNCYNFNPITLVKFLSPLAVSYNDPILTSTYSRTVCRFRYFSADPDYRDLELVPSHENM